MTALLFGSYVSGELTEESDIDTVIVTAKDSINTILHPYIDGIKLDLSFYSIKQLKKKCDTEVDKREREPMIARCLILFDKRGRLTNLVNELNTVKPKKWNPVIEAEQRFLMYHANDKVVRNLNKDPLSSLYSMGVGVNELLKTHYLINERWWLSNKKLLYDLKQWDIKMYKLLEKFLKESKPNKKYTLWKKIYNYILSQLGGFKPLDENIPEEFIGDIQLINNNNP